VPFLARLWKVGSLTDSLSIYVPAKIIQKALGFVRLLLFIYLLPKSQLALWGLGMLIVTVLAPLLTLGSQHGMVRYASTYEVKGQLGSFYHRVRFPILLIGLGMSIVAFAASGQITRLVISTRSGAAGIGHEQQLALCRLALANATAMVMYHNVLGLIIGMRAYRLVAALEILLTVLFAATSIAAVAAWPVASAALAAHLLSLLVVLVAAVAGLHACLRNLPPCAAESAPSAAVLGEAQAVESISDTDAMASLAELSAAGPIQPQQESAAPALGRVLAFGLHSLPGFMLWQWATYTSFWLTSKLRGMSAGGEFMAFLALGQPLVFLADAVWAVVFTHVVRRWEANRRDEALQTLQVAYRAVAMLMLTLSLALLASSSLWIRALPQRYQHAQPLLGGLFLFFQVMIHLALLTILAKVHERPWVTALAGALGIAANVVLAVRWMDRFEYAPQAAALAAGVGIYAATTAVTLLYVALTRTSLRPATVFVVLAPGVLLLPTAVAVVLWAVVLAVAALTPWFFTAQQKRLVLDSVRRSLRRLGFARWP